MCRVVVESRSFLLPSDLQLELENWAETGQFDSTELHEVRPANCLQRLGARGSWELFLPYETQMADSGVSETVNE